MKEIKELIKDKTDEELSETLWLNQKHFFKERPVTIQEFIASDEFVHKKWPNIFPIWQKTLAELYPSPFYAPYNEVLISAAAGCVDKETEVLTDTGWIKIDEYDNQNVAVYYPNGEIKYEQPIEYISGEIDVWYHFKNKDVDMKLSPEHSICYYDDELNIISAEELSQLDREIELPTPTGRVKINGKRDVLIETVKPFEKKYCFRTSTNMWTMRRNGKTVVTGNSGKTVTSTISILYDIYKLGCLKNPCQYYGLTPDTMIIMAIFSATGSTAAVNWNEITTGIKSCPWIMNQLVDKRGLEKKNGSITPVEIIPGIYIQTGSKFQHSMGKAIYSGLMDEAAFGGANMKDAQKSYNELSSRIKTRFSTWGTKGVTPGHLFLISSPKEAGDFMQYRIETAQKSGSKLTKVMQNIATWDADPRKDSDDKFTVFIGNENKEPCIYDPDEDVPFEEMDYLIYPPMRYYEDFKKDLLISIMNYGGITTTSDMALFKGVTALNEVFVLGNPFKSDVLEVPFSKTDKSLMDYINLDYFKDIRHPEYNRFIHLDAAFSTNTTDVYGLAASYCIFTEKSSYTGKFGEAEREDIYTQKDRMFFVDFAVGITAPKGEEVPLYKIQDFIEWLGKHDYPIAAVSADQFQSKQSLQNLKLKGFETENISVDKTRDPYLFLRQLVYNKQILIPKNNYLKEELKRLRDDGKKVDHPSCFTGDTKIKLVDGRDVSINDLLLEQEYKQNWVYTFNEQTKKIEPKKIRKVFQSGITKSLVKVTLDNGEVITCTPEHRFMLRDGSYEEIQNLKEGTSLMSLYTKISYSGLNGYRMYYEPMEEVWHYEHRSFGSPMKEKNITHHCNYNKLNNCLTNLKTVSSCGHTTVHKEILQGQREYINHKIVSIEFISMPCKVYDLEIEDNHNFALSAGVIVHNSWHKDIGDAVAGSIWNCANSNKVLNSGRIARKALGGSTYNPTQAASLEVMEFERIKQNMASMFKGM